MKRLLFIFNPQTGGGRLKHNLLAILCAFAGAGYEATVHPTTGPGDARRVAAEHAAEYDLVVACGGDGTLNETVHGLSGLYMPPPLGYIPGGTTNDFASSLKLPKSSMVAAAQRAVKPKKEYLVDIGRTEGRIFTYVAAFGAFTDVPFTTNQKTKNLLGYAAYLMEGVSRLPSLPSYNVRVHCDGEEFSDELIFGMVSNSTSVAGFSFDDIGKIYLDDGVFEVLLLRRPHNIADIGGLSAALLTHNIESPYIKLMRGREILIEADTPIQWTLDGEDGGERQSTYIQVQKQALRIHI